MDASAFLNEANLKLHEMIALIQRAEQLVKEGADCEELCEEARKLAESWDSRQPAQSPDTAPEASSRVSSESSCALSDPPCNDTCPAEPYPDGAHP